MLERATDLMVDGVTYVYYEFTAMADEIEESW